MAPLVGARYSVMDLMQNVVIVEVQNNEVKRKSLSTSLFFQC